MTQRAAPGASSRLCDHRGARSGGEIETTQPVSALGFQSGEYLDGNEGNNHVIELEIVYDRSPMGWGKWPGLLAEYEAAILQFDRATRAVTEALIARDQLPGDLIKAEHAAREAVVHARIRLVEHWRETATAE